MTDDLVPHRMPWEPVPEPTPQESIELLKRDFAYAVVNTAIIVHSNNPAFGMLANTKRGQVVPRGEVKFRDGTTVELQDIGMCQPNVPYMTVQEIMSQIWETATALGLELVK